LYQFDKTTTSLKEIRPYSEKGIAFRYGFYGVIDRKKNEAAVYSYDHKFIRTIKGLNNFPAFDPSAEEINEPVAQGPEEEETEAPSLGQERFRMLKGSRGRTIDAFRPEDDYIPISVNVSLDYHAEFKISGKKGDWLVDAHYNSYVRRPQKDTVFHVFVDKLSPLKYGSSGILITQVGKLYGAVDSRGNVIFPPNFKKLELENSFEGYEWIVARDADRSTLFYYNPLSKQADVVLIGSAKDVFNIRRTFIEVKHPTGKNTYQMKLVKWSAPDPLKAFVVSDKNEFYDSIVKNKLFPFFFQTYKGGKTGFISEQMEAVIPCIYDSIELDAYYMPRIYKYSDAPVYKLIQPIFSVYSNGKQQIIHPTKNPTSKTLLHSFTDGSLNPTATISYDGLFLTDPVGEGRVEVYSIDGKKLTKEPILLAPENEKYASFTEEYWYLRGKDTQGKEILIGQNGAWFVLP
jgi:hypothetical protein